MLLKTEAASTSAGMTHRRKLCVPALLAIGFMKMENPVNLQVDFKVFLRDLGESFQGLVLDLAT